MKRTIGRRRGRADLLALTPAVPVAAAPAVDYCYNATITRIVDADTYEVRVDVGFHMSAELPLRLAHVDAPEHYTPEGKAAIAYVTDLIGAVPRPVVVRTVKVGDKFGRYLADVWVDGRSLADLLLENGHAVRYEGGTKGVPVP